jgi:uncharacterized protein
MKQKLIRGLIIFSIFNFTTFSAIAVPTPYRILRYESVVGQTSDYTCGPAAVATLLIHYYGIESSESEILELAHQAIRERGGNPEEGRGISGLALKQALANKGIRSEPYRILPENLADYFNQDGLPLILHVTRPNLHYVVAIGMIDNYVVIADPSWGRKIIHLNVLINEKGFEGMTLIPFTPRSLLDHARQQQNNTLMWAENRLNRLGR